MFIQEIKYEDVLKIRKETLYADLDNPDLVKLDNDHLGIHIGLIDKSVLVGVVSLFLKERKLQFRKLAVKKEFQREGYGSALIKWIIDYANEMLLEEVWANARKEVLDFYLKNDFEEVGEEFSKNEIEYTIIKSKNVQNKL